MPVAARPQPDAVIPPGDRSHSGRVVTVRLRDGGHAGVARLAGFAGVDVSPGNRRTIDCYSSLSDDFFASLGPDGDFGRRVLLNPTIFRLLGAVEGKTIMDAGRGHGYLSRLLADRGAHVVGIEPATVPLAYATRLEDERSQGIRYLQRDLSALGDPGGPFDAVVANMVLLDIPDWRPALANCISALKPGGILVYSLHHPVWAPRQFGAWAARGVVEVRDYLNEHDQTGGHAPSFHRPLSLYLNATVRLGGAITEVVEPQLRSDQIEHPEQEIFTRIPNYIVIAARRERIP
jgi:2-polyprenyl-3-methyl-5-hydroxy-6-metoxy-1,4-benzoquinol methylase